MICGKMLRLVSAQPSPSHLQSAHSLIFSAADDGAAWKPDTAGGAGDENWQPDGAGGDDGLDGFTGDNTSKHAGGAADGGCRK